MKNKNIAESFKNAFNGFKNAFIKERNFKIHVLTAIGVICASVYFEIDTQSFVSVILSVCTVLTAELINTAVEAMIDLYCGENLNPYAKIAKDSAAAAVLISSVFAVIIGVTVFGDKVLNLLGIGQ